MLVEFIRGLKERAKVIVLGVSEGTIEFRRPVIAVR